jgi:uncharacterized protein
LKLVVPEAETAALRRFLERDPAHASAAIAYVEVMRAATRYGPEARATASAVLFATTLLEVDQDLLVAAASLEGSLRTLDAIHVAAAGALRRQLGALVSYDTRMLAAATAVGLPTAAPGRSG